MSAARLPDPREKPWLTVAELAEITGEGEKAIRAAIDAGQLPCLRISRYVRIPTAQLLRQLEGDVRGPDSDDVAATAEAQRTDQPRLGHVHVLDPGRREPRASPGA